MGLFHHGNLGILKGSVQRDGTEALNFRKSCRSLFSYISLYSADVGESILSPKLICNLLSKLLGNHPKCNNSKSISIIYILILYQHLSIPSGKLTWQLKSTMFNRRYIFTRSIFGCHVSLLEGIQ